MDNKLHKNRWTKTNQPVALHSVQVHGLHDFVLHEPARSQQYQRAIENNTRCLMLSMFRPFLQSSLFAATKEQLDMLKCY
jgi:hypothetical protein